MAKLSVLLPARVIFSPERSDSVEEWSDSVESTSSLVPRDSQDRLNYKETGISILAPGTRQVYTQSLSVDPLGLFFFPRGAVLVSPGRSFRLPGLPDFAGVIAPCYPVATASASIRRTMLPNNRRVRWLSASISQ